MSDIVLTLDQNDPTFFDAMLRSIYKSPSIACIRELIRNAIDSHLDSGQTEKVDIQFSGKFFYLRDYGTGITPTQLEKLLSVLMRSGKRNSDSKATGGYGLGSKTVFGVLFEDIRSGRDQSEIFMTSITNGVKRLYQLLVENSQPKYRLLSEQPTKEPSGLSYLIEMNSSMKKMDHDTFLTIFAPILQHLNFVGGVDFNEYIKNFNIGGYLVSILRKPIDATVMPFSNNIADSNRYKGHLTRSWSDQKFKIMYKDMIYPMQPSYNYLVCDEDLIEYVERQIEDDNAYEYSSDDFIIALDIGTESFGMEPTKPRDALIIDSMTDEQCSSFIEHMKNSKVIETHKAYILSIIYSTLRRFNTYLQGNTVHSHNLINEGYFNEINLIENVTTLVSHYILSDDFITTIDSRKVRNLAYREFDTCVKEEYFDSEAVRSVFSCEAIFSGYLLSDRSHMTIQIEDEFISIYTSIFEQLGVESQLNDPLKRTHHSSVINYRNIVYQPNDALVCSSVIRNEVNGKLYFSNIMSVVDGDVRSDSTFNYSLKDDNNVVIWYKDRKSDARKIEKWATDHPDKTLFIVERYPLHDAYGKDNSRMVDRDSVLKRTTRCPNIKMMLLDYHKDHPIEMMSDILPTIKIKAAPKKKRNKDELKVNDLSVTARSVELHCHIHGSIDNPTYRNIVDTVKNSDKVLVFKKNESTITKNYYDNHFRVVYGYSYNKLSILFKNNNCTNYYTSIGTNSLMNISSIYLCGKESNAITEFLNNNPNVDDGTTYLELLIKEFENNQFKEILGYELVIPTSISYDINDVLYKQLVDFSTEYISKARIESRMFASLYGSNGQLAYKKVAEHLIKRHIINDDCTYKIIDGEYTDLMLLNYNEAEILNYVNSHDDHKKQFKELIDGYTTYEFMILNNLVDLTNHSLSKGDSTEKHIAGMEKICKL